MVLTMAAPLILVSNRGPVTFSDDAAVPAVWSRR
jgi:hypothetical protein